MKIQLHRKVAFSIVPFLVVFIFVVFTNCAISAGPKIRNVVKFGFSRGGEPNTLNPILASNATTITLVWHLYSRLVDLDEKGRVIPMVAEKWSVSKDLKKWRFSLRSDVNFFSEEPSVKRVVTASDVKASVEYSVSKPTLGRSMLAGLVVGIDDFIGGKAKEIKGIKVQGQDIVFHLTRPFAFLSDRLALSFFSILPTEHIDEIEKGAVIGSGPYILESFNQTTKKIVLIRNPKYWDKKVQPVAASLEIYWMPNEGSLVSEFRAGNLDWIELSSKATPKVPEGKAESLYPTLNVALVVFNIKSKKIDLALRKYLECITDREALARYFPGSVPVQGPYPSMILRDYGIPLPQKCGKAIKKPGCKEDLELLIMPMEPYKTIGRLLARHWQAKGFKIKPILGQADFIKRLMDGKFDISLAYFGPMSPSPEQYSWPYLSAFRPLPNAAGYSNENVDNAYEKLVSKMGEGEQNAAIKTINEIVAKDVPVINLFRLSFRIWHSKEFAPNAFVNGIMSFLSPKEK